MDIGAFEVTFKQKAAAEGTAVPADFGVAGMTVSNQFESAAAMATAYSVLFAVL
jgi:hypothetical protein